MRGYVRKIQINHTRNKQDHTMLLDQAAKSFDYAAKCVLEPGRVLSSLWDAAVG